MHVTIDQHNDISWGPNNPPYMHACTLLHQIQKVNSSKSLLLKFLWLEPFCRLGGTSLSVFEMECDGLASLWEGDPEVRNRLLKDAKFLDFPKNKSFCEPTRSNCVDNLCILKPILTKLSVVPGFKLPKLDPLQAELALLAEKLGVTSLGQKAVYQAAVSIKKLAGLIKRRVRRKEVTKDIMGPNMTKQYIHDDWFQQVRISHSVVVSIK